MYSVEELFGGPEYRTAVWVSKVARDKLDRFARDNEGKRFLKKLDYYARAGFASFESSSGPIRSEGNGVFRVGHGSTLFRLIGFYDQGKSEFIAIDALHKHGQKLSRADRDRIRGVAEVRRAGDWKKERNR